MAKITLGSVYTVPSGTVANIIVYNAAQSGSLTFLLSFSSSVVTRVSLGLLFAVGTMVAIF